MPLRTAKLTDEEVLALRARKARGEAISVKAEADKFQCGLETIRKVLRGDTFRHLLHEKPSAQTGPSETEVEASLTRFLSEVQAAKEDPDADIQALFGKSGGIS